ncbi:MAG TPA: S8 family serine peptidase, partial [Polyangiaceae bacterium]
ADVELGGALRTLRRGVIAPGRAIPSTFRADGAGAVPLLIEVPEGAAPPAPEAVRVGDRWFALHAGAERLEELASTRPELRLHWSPGRRLLLDRADGWIRASSMRGRSGATGRGVAIGIVDTGVDVTHADLRNADGTTRVRWLIDFGRPALGLHPELESELGCRETSSPCAIYAAADIDERIGNGVLRDEPIDAFGHGTHVASLAAGNGLSLATRRYVGVAPEAELLVADVGGGDPNAIPDSAILRAVRFVFDRAEDAGAPVVLNLSLGSDFGAHDGSSALERALSAYVGPGQPGRAIVVAAGNSAGLTAEHSEFSQPLGVHTSVHVPRNSPVRIPLVIPRTNLGSLRASVYVWLGFRQNDDISVGLDRNGSALVEAVPAGVGNTYSRDGFDAVVLNGVRDAEQALRGGARNAVVILDGRWGATDRFEILLRGHGTASLWVQSAGQLGPSVSPGALLPFASKEGTINVPASAPALIAVGATLNRVEWTDYQGTSVQRRTHGSLGPAPPDTTAFFSSAGPNALGVMKPDLVAPGAYLVGALSAAADPRTTGAGMFDGAGVCAPGSQCLVVDDTHAISSGTSMAAPLVAGAIALLLERDPGLTQEGVRALLQAGARSLEGAVFSAQQTGVGALDLEGTLDAQLAQVSPIERVPTERSWLSFAASHARPDPEWPLTGYLELRDSDGQLADGFDSRRLRFSVFGGSEAEPLTRIAPGLHRFSIRTERGSGGGRLRVEARFDGAVLAAGEVPIAVDRGAATGAVSPRGGCRIGIQKPPGTTAALVILAALALFRTRRRPFRREHALTAARSKP